MARAWLVWIASWAIVVLILAALCVAQEFGLRNATRAMGWRGWSCLTAVVIGAVALLLIAINVIGVLP